MCSKPVLTLASVQFEMIEDDKTANLNTMTHYMDEARIKGVDVIAFPEICTTGYHYLCTSTKEQLLEIAEPLNGPTVEFIHAKAKETGLTVLFGMLELADNEEMYNTYLVVTPQGVGHSYRKVHAFENSAILQGDKLETFDIHGWKCGILICYDNNLPENTRVLALEGAEIVFAPHQTGGFDIEKAGMGRIPLKLWQQRKKNPVPMRHAILGPKGYQWITKWLPCRAYDNNVFYVFSNGVGIDGPEVRVGCNMIIDPEGIILAETTRSENDMVIASINKDMRKNTLSGSHVLARRPSLYNKLIEPIDEVDTRKIRNMVSGETIV